MAAPAFEFADCSEFKAMRCARRNKSLSKKQNDYERFLEQRAQGASGNPSMKRVGSVPVSHRRSCPHRAARAAKRTGMAKGVIESETDVPAISMGRMGERKPSISPMLLTQASSKNIFVQDDPTAETETTASEGMEVHGLPVDWSSPASTFTADPFVGNALDDDVLDIGESASISDDGTDHFQDDTTAVANSGTSLEQAPLDVYDEPRLTVPCQDQVTTPVAEGEQVSAHEASRREQILRNVVEKLREQARIAQQEAQMERTKAHELEQQVASQKRNDTCSAKKSALQAEKQRSAQLRKQRNQAAHLQAMKEKADQTLKEAANIRSRAEAEAAEKHAQLLADASKIAQEQVEARVQEVMNSALADAEALKLDSEEAAKQARELKRDAEVALERAKEQAKKESLVAQAAKDEADALRSAAEMAAQAIRKKALEDAMSLKMRVAEQLLQKAKADEKARQEVVDSLPLQAEAAAVKLQQDAEARARNERAAVLKRAKEMDQQRSKKFQKQNMRERFQEQRRQRELDAARVCVEEQCHKAKQVALADIQAMKAKAKAEIKAARRCAAAEAKAEAQARLHEDRREADEVQRQAELEPEEAQKVQKDKTLDVQVATPAPNSEEQVELEVGEDWQVLVTTEMETIDNDWDVLA